MMASPASLLRVPHSLIMNSSVAANSSGMNGGQLANNSRIREVWSTNFEAETEAIRNSIGKYRYVSFDTEFPGIVARPMGQFKNANDWRYQTMRCNVDILKIIQLGLTLSDEDGRDPASEEIGMPCTWQFNFHFDLANDILQLRECGAIS